MRFDYGGRAAAISTPRLIRWRRDAKTGLEPQVCEPAFMAYDPIIG